MSPALGPGADPAPAAGPGGPESVDVLVRDASWVVPLHGPDVEGGWVACDSGAVTAIGPPGREPPARRVLDATGAVVTPGLVNAHHHLFQNLTRAFAPACASGLDDWLSRLRPLWARLDEETAYLSAWVGLAELALAGCTTTADNLYLHPRPGLVEATLRAAAEVGLRLDPCRGFIEHDALPVAGAERDGEILDHGERLLAEFHDPGPASRVRVSLGPTALAAANPKLLAATAELAARYGARLHTHLFEQAHETERALARFGRPPVRVLTDAGWADRAWIAHGSHATPADAAALAAAGIGVAHCPTSNLMLGDRTAPVTLLREADCPVGLGTDGAASAGLAQPWLEARTALLLARLGGGPAALSARDVLRMATVGGARCLGRAGEVGALAPGMQADLVVWDVGGVGYSGACTDPVETWLRGGPPRVRHTVVGGRPVVADGVLQAAGLDERLRRHHAHARDWQQADAPTAHAGASAAHAGAGASTAPAGRPQNGREA